jgi:hypothetical protein
LLQRQRKEAKKAYREKEPLREISRKDKSQNIKGQTGERKLRGKPSKRDISTRWIEEKFPVSRSECHRIRCLSFYQIGSFIPPPKQPILSALGCYQHPRFMGCEGLALWPTLVHPRWEKISPSYHVREPPTLASFRVEAVGSRTDLGKGKTMFEGLASRLERNQLLDELYGDLGSIYPPSTGRLDDLLDGFEVETDVPSEKGNAASSDREAA